MGLQEVVSELNRLRREHLIAEYAIGGGIAAPFYIEATATEDVDVFIGLTGPFANSLAPLSGIYTDLLQRGAKQDDLYLVIGGWPVQFLPADDPLYDDAVARARDQLFGDEIGRIMGPEHLAVIALRTGRMKDKLRLDAFLKMPFGFSRSLFESLIARFGLTDSWIDFQSKFLAK